MPRGVVIAVTPTSTKDNSITSEEKSIFEQGCTGLVRITDGEHAGQVGYYQQTGACCRARSGQAVDLDIIRVGKDGVIFVELINC